MDNRFQMDLETAKCLSILRWQAYVDAEGYCPDEELPDAVKGIKSHCGFCQRWRSIETYSFSGCCMCELAEIDGRCLSNQSHYDKWCDRSTKENAQKMLDVIKSIPT